MPELSLADLVVLAPGQKVAIVLDGDPSVHAELRVDAQPVLRALKELTGIEVYWVYPGEDTQT